MKGLLFLIRILTGGLFIFSGLVKAIDPRGLGYKMQEFFEVWAASGYFKGLMSLLDQYALGVSVFMITLEVAVGLALIIGWRKKLTLWILLLLILFFTFLTSYVLFSGKIRACGCFGDCIPLTPIQTFTKDIILLIFAVILLLSAHKMKPLFSNKINGFIILIGVALTLFLQYYVLKHLPIKDCLPYKVGNNILELRKIPADAIPDKYDYTFVYEKDNVKKDFPASALPDSSWDFSERKQILIQKGKNNVALINDFALSNEEGLDVTSTVLSANEQYYILFMKEVPENVNQWLNNLKKIIETSNGKKIYVVTAQRSATEDFLKANNVQVSDVLTSDGTAIKTAARNNPTIFKMNGPVVQGKWSWADFNKVNTN